MDPAFEDAVSPCWGDVVGAPGREHRLRYPGPGCTTRSGLHRAFVENADLLESKLRPAAGARRSRVARERSSSRLEGRARPRSSSLSAGPGWGKTTLLAAVGLGVGAPVRVAVDRREGQRPDRPADLCRGRARPRLAARSECVRRARVTRCVGRGDGRPAPGRGSGGDGRSRSSWSWTTCTCSRPGRLGRRRGAGATRPGGLAADALRARRAGAAPGSASRPRPDAGDRAGRPPHDRDRGSPAPACRRRGPVRGAGRRAHPTDRGLVGRSLSRRAVDPGAGDQGQGRGDVLRERPPRLRLPASRRCWGTSPPTSFAS